MVETTELNLSTSLAELDAYVSSDSESPNCTDARTRRAAAQQEAKRWENLVYAVGAATAAVLVAGLVFFFVDGFTGAAVAAAGLVVGGAGTLFLVNQRNRAQSREGAAWKDVLKYCKVRTQAEEKVAREAARLSS
jgi:hypothetical protein